jgi:hypothetical protein
VPRSSGFLLLGLLCSASLLAAARPAAACDSSSCLLVTRGQNGLLGKGVVRVDLSFRHTPMTALLEGSEQVDRVLRPKVDFEDRRLVPGFHDELGGTDNFLQLDLAYGLGARSSIFVSMPILAARDFDIGHPPVLRETFSTTGNGDALLGLRYSLHHGATDSLVGGLSVELPSGKHTLVSPANRADSGILDPMLQPGTGSVDLGATLQYGRRLGGAWDSTLAASFQYYTTNDLDYRWGQDTIVSASVSRPLFGAVSGSLQVKLAHKARARFLDQDVPGTGGRFVYLTPGLSVRAPGQLSVYGYLVTPVYRYVNEAQLGPRAGFVFGLSRSF